MSTLFDMQEILDTVIHGDALEVLKTLPDCSIDAICADPPSSINFMNKSWDSDKGGRTQWVAWLSEIMREARRCLRPGGHALVWSLPRTSHWTALALEDAGFEIRDCLYQLVSGDTILYNFIQSLSEEQQHAFMQIIDGQREPSGVLQIFGSGFPKSLSVDKAIDKHLKIEREIVGYKDHRSDYDGCSRDPNNVRFKNVYSNDGGTTLSPISKPSSEAAQRYSGFGSALKPAVENWWLVRKPLAASSIAENVLQYGTGAINIDGCRISHDEPPKTTERIAPRYSGTVMNNGNRGGIQSTIASAAQNGRFPSHLLLTHTPSCIQVGTKRVRGTAPRGKPSAWQPHNQDSATSYSLPNYASGGSLYTDEDGMETVTAWQCPDFCPVRILDAQGGLRKSGALSIENGNRVITSGVYGTNRHGGKIAREPTEGYVSRYFQQLPALDDIPPYIYAGKASRRDRTADNTVINTHPTVKSLALSKYLVRLVTPKDGIVLDCFAGSGSILCAAILEGFHFVGIEREEEYVQIARKRIQHAMSTSGIQQPDIPLSPSAPPTTYKTRNKIHSSQLTLWDKEQA